MDAKQTEQAQRKLIVAYQWLGLAGREMLPYMTPNEREELTRWGESLRKRLVKEGRLPKSGRWGDAASGVWPEVSDECWNAMG